MAGVGIVGDDQLIPESARTPRMHARWIRVISALKACPLAGYNKLVSTSGAFRLSTLWSAKY